MWADSPEYTENPQIVYFNFVITMHCNYTGSSYILNKKYTYIIKQDFRNRGDEAKGKFLRLFSTINSKYNLPIRRKGKQKQVYHTYHIWLHRCSFQQGFGLRDYSDTPLSLWVTARDGTHL